jgi:hypothetical protein
VSGAASLLRARQLLNTLDRLLQLRRRSPLGGLNVLLADQFIGCTWVIPWSLRKAAMRAASCFKNSFPSWVMGVPEPSAISKEVI